MPHRYPLRCVLFLTAVAVALTAGAQDFTVVFCGVGNNSGEEGSQWIADLMVMDMECGEHPLSPAGGPCWSQIEMEIFSKDGHYGDFLFDEQVFERGDQAPLVRFENILGKYNWHSPSCIKLTSNVEFYAIVKSRNVGHPSGEFGFLMLPTQPLVSGERYLWPISGDRGNCFAFIEEFGYSALFIEHEDETKTSFWVYPGCNLFTGFRYGDTIEVRSDHDVYLGCSSIINSTSDGVAVTLVPEFKQE